MEIAIREILHQAKIERNFNKNHREKKKLSLNFVIELKRILK
jgi:hypothetical protein